MIDRETLKKHAAMFDTMSQKLGHDMQQRALDGDIPFDEIADGVLRCAQCSSPEDCASRMAKTTQLDAPFSYCQNTELFKDL
jgi:hypothetical protein